MKKNYQKPEVEKIDFAEEITSGDSFIPGFGEGSTELPGDWD